MLTARIGTEPVVTETVVTEMVVIEAVVTEAVVTQVVGEKTIITVEAPTPMLSSAAAGRFWQFMLSLFVP